MHFEKDRGHIAIDEKYIFIIYKDRMNGSRKWPITFDGDYNSKLLHEILKIANLGKYFLTEEALKTFDKLIAEWKGENDA